MNLLEQFKGKYTKESLAVIEQHEQLLKFKKFDDEDAFNLGAIIYRRAKEMGPVGIRITRESDELPIFQFMMTPKYQRNINFGLMKRNVVMKTGHNSFWALVKGAVDGGLDEVFLDENCLPVGGCFPIYVGDEMVADVFVSGLHEGKDYTLIVDSMSELLGVTLPEFKDELM